jgi:hypothetical protein
MMNDELQVYRGKDFVVSKYIVMRQPTLGEICDYGESKYFGLIHNLISTGANYKWQLFDNGIDYTKVDDFELFRRSIIKGLTTDYTSIIFGDLDFTKFEEMIVVKNNEPCIAQMINGEPVIIDGYTYKVIVDYLRKVHGFKRDNKVPANESTKMILIEDDREEYLRNINKEPKSYLLNLVSSMINCSEFKYDHETVWNMKLGAFMDSVKRIKKIKQADLLLQSEYSGYGINLKDLDKKELDWLGELD